MLCCKHSQKRNQMTTFTATENLTESINDFLVSVIETVTDDVYRVSDEEDIEPCEENNFLLSEDGKEFKGVFWDMDEIAHEFVIREDDNGVWSICF